MDFFTFKKSGHKEYTVGGYFFVGLAIFLILFLIIFATGNGFLMALTFSLIASAVAAIWTILTDHFGKLKHNSIHKSILFQSLREEGFQEEKYGEYIGLIKVINGSTVRVYYDWNKTAKGFLLLSSGDIVIEIFFNPLINIEGDEWVADTNRINSLNRKYRQKPIFTGMYRIIGKDRFFIYLNYYRWLKYGTILNEIRIAMSIMQEEGLKSFDIENHNVEIHQDYFLPDTELVWDEMEKRNE